MDVPSASRPRVVRSRLLRVLLAVLGLVCLTLGLFGIVVPGLPTTVFVIAASCLFVRSCPVLEQRLLRTRVFRPYLRYVDGDCPIPREARWKALFLMWGGVSLSAVWLLAGESPATWTTLGVVLAALVGSVFVLRYRVAQPVRDAREVQRVE